MSRIVLIHWSSAEAEPRARRLHDVGHEVEVYSDQQGGGLRRLVENPPAAFVIDLSRLPSQGRGVATWLRQHASTRAVPIAFVGGQPDKVAATRALLPDAGYTDWSRVELDLPEIIACPNAAPVVPDAMAEYHAVPLAKKLGLKERLTVALLGAPPGLEQLLEPLPKGARLSRRPRKPVRLVLLFVRSRADLERRLPAAISLLAEGGGVWVAWPKRASGIDCDLNQGVVRAHGLDASLVDYKICSVDATWSALLFARRRG